MREKSNQKCSNNFLWAQYVDVLYLFLDTDYQTSFVLDVKKNYTIIHDLSLSLGLIMS